MACEVNDLTVTGSNIDTDSGDASRITITGTMPDCKNATLRITITFIADGDSINSIVTTDHDGNFEYIFDRNLKCGYNVGISLICQVDQCEYREEISLTCCPTRYDYQIRGINSDGDELSEAELSGDSNINPGTYEFQIYGPTLDPAGIISWSTNPADPVEDETPSLDGSITYPVTFPGDGIERVIECVIKIPGCEEIEVYLVLRDTGERVCPEGFHWDEEQQDCIEDEPITPPDEECPEGQHWDEELGRCIEDKPITPPDEECPEGQHWDDNLKKCVPNKPPPGGGRGGFKCAWWYYQMQFSLAISLISGTLIYCNPAIWEILAGITVVAAVSAGVAYFLWKKLRCPRECGWKKLFWAQVLLFAGGGLLLFGGCCPVARGAGIILIIAGVSLYIAWGVNCRVNVCGYIHALAAPVVELMGLSVATWTFLGPLLGCPPPMILVWINIVGGIIEIIALKICSSRD